MTLITIRDHKVEGHEQKRTPNVGGRIDPRFIVLHYTASGSLDGSCNHLCNPAAKASAHLVVGRDGEIVQLAPFNVRTWHAGTSRWGTRVGLNSCSVGIEMVNWGPLTRSGDGGFRTYAGQAIDASRAVEGRQKIRPETWWESFTAVQIAATEALCRALMDAYGIAAKDVIRHEDIAPKRKSDPGPAWDHAAFRARLEGRADNFPGVY